jgi:hypothetical protein
MRPAERRGLVATPPWQFDQRFQKTPAYTGGCASDKNPRVYH